MKYLLKCVFLFLLIIFNFLLAESELLEQCNYFDDHKKLGKCYENYMESFNVTHNEITYDKYIEATNKYFQSWNSTEKLCNNFRALKKCIGPSIIKNCMNVEDFEYIFMNLDHTKMEQIQYVINFHQFDYICNYGFEDYKKSFECINKLKIYCGNYGTTCKEAEDGLQCSTKKANDECGKDGYDYIENIFSIGLCYTRQSCKKFCHHQPTITREIREIINGSSSYYSLGLVSVIIVAFPFFKSLIIL